MKSRGPIDARTTAVVCVERLDEIEGNARPAPAVLNRFVAALPAAPPAPAKGDAAVDSDEGGLLKAQPAALPLAEPPRVPKREVFFFCLESTTIKILDF